MTISKATIPIVLIILFLTPTLMSVAAPVIEDSQISLSKTGYQVSSYDIDRVNYKANNFENPGFEEWTDSYHPALLSSSVSSDSYASIVSSPWPVANGSSSLTMQVRSLTGDFSQHNMDEGSYTWWANPVNLTMSFYYYIENIPNPISSDYFMLEFRLGSAGTRYLQYYFGSSTTSTNSSYNRYFNIGASPGQWHLFDRNITADYIDGFSVTPVQYQGFDFYLRSYSRDYAQVFLDTIYLYNTTLYKSDTYDASGDFRGGIYSNNDPGVLSQSDTRIEGDYSMNMSTYSLGNRSYADIEYNFYKRFTEMNQDTFEFWWRIDDWTVYSEETFAYVYVECMNATHEFYVYYPLGYGDTFKYTYPGYHIIIPDAFNTTGSWNHFNRSIWDDITSRNSTNEVIISSIEFCVGVDEYQANITLLLDDMSLYSAALNDMSYEDEGAVGGNAYAWEIEHNIRKNMNVTSTSYTGSKAANVTVGSSSYLYAQQELAYIDLNSSSELYLTFAYYIDDFTNLTNDYMEITLYFEDAEDSLRYVLANGSSRYSESDYFILLDSTQGQWHVEERELVVDYTSAFGMAPTDRLVGIYIEAQGEGRIEILLDDFYLYEDPAPTITNLIQNPTNPEYDDNATISVDVVDPHLDDVLLHFRINEGSFIIEEMNEQTPGTYQAVIPVLDYGDVVEYFISANDTYGKTTNLMDESTYFTYMVQDTILPSVSITNPENGSTVSDTIVITIEASDTGSDIQRVLIYIDSTLVANLTEGSFTHSWDTTEDTDGLHEIYVEAVDNADNINSCLHIVTVANNGSTTPTPTTDTTSGIPPPPDLALVVVIVGIAIGVTVVVIVLLLRTKKS